MPVGCIENSGRGALDKCQADSSWIRSTTSWAERTAVSSNGTPSEAHDPQ